MSTASNNRDVVVDGIKFTYCHARPHAQFAPFWWVGHPTMNGHLTFSCVSEIGQNIERVRLWLKGGGHD